MYECEREHGIVTASMCLTFSHTTVVKRCKPNVIAALRISTVDAAGSQARGHARARTRWLARTGGSQLCRYYLRTSMHSQVPGHTHTYISFYEHIQAGHQITRFHQPLKGKGSLSGTFCCTQVGTSPWAGPRKGPDLSI